MTQIKTITFACENSSQLASFWAEAMEGDRRDLPSYIDPEVVNLPGEGPDLLFKEMPKGTQRDLPIHIDLTVEDRELTVKRFCDLGASVRETKTETYGPNTETWTIMEDPEGNGFCVTEQ
ncbi:MULTISPECIES: VOC family protein [Natrialba]|uniref:Glyoxalase/bleomycin resistance protein/dioxygenase n=2 Tax=Natrialba TaxID=63742 RepID=M0AQZ5_9EURY|nr:MULTISPECIES: VOC family protein [Natrialba]ELZ00747.1 glyoxalase/bleomycin resistance protein/dioxygenase [Natrialba aegyptia DSM 13077]